VVEIPAEHQVGPGSLFGTIQEGSYLELAFVVGMERISMELKECGTRSGSAAIAGESSSGRI